jgi:CheY-like chemotaxis protein
LALQSRSFAFRTPGWRVRSILWHRTTQHAFSKVPIRNPDSPNPQNPQFCSDVTNLMSQKRLICIVDDNQCFRDALEALIVSMDYAAAAFASAEDYLNSDLVVRTSCLISDWQMPGMNGGDLQDRLTATGHHVPTIFVTAVCPEKERARLLKAGALGILEKPFDVNVFIECLQRALASAGERGPRD